MFACREAFVNRYDHEIRNHFQAIDFPVSEDLSLGGTYSGVEQMGLMWSLRPVPGSKPGLR